MTKWLKIGRIAGVIALGITVLGVAAWVILQPTQVEARGGRVRMPQTTMAERFSPPSQLGQMGPFGDFGRGERFDGQIDYDSLLAEALGISVEELQAAREKANAAALQQAIDQGLITQEQADLMAARRQLMGYLDQDTLLAKALGISAEELQAAYDEDKPLVVLAWELKIDQDTLRANMQKAHAEAIQQAVADGVITQEQADKLQDNQKGAPPGGFGFPGGPGRGGGGFGWR
ncbi:MAG: hypothetical protein JXM69_17495 [Anaerolineae bacterium]|nr:hypothetical protein [Anaerolineae bacterium]